MTVTDNQSLNQCRDDLIKFKQELDTKLSHYERKKCTGNFARQYQKHYNAIKYILDTLIVLSECDDWIKLRSLHFKIAPHYTDQVTGEVLRNCEKFDIVQSKFEFKFTKCNGYTLKCRVKLYRINPSAKYRIVDMLKFYLFC